MSIGSGSRERAGDPLAALVFATPAGHNGPAPDGAADPSLETAVIHHFFLLKELVKRDFQGRYAGSLLGFFWSFVNPVFLLALYTLVFSEILKMRLEREVTDSFPLFLFAGLLPWLALSEGIARSATAVTDNANLVKKLTFPSEMLILSVVLAALIHEGIAVLVFSLFLGVTGQLGFGGLPLLLAIVPVQLAITVGLGLLLASINVFFRDTSQILGMAFGAWFFLTPIVYPRTLVPERYQGLLELNPLTPLVELYRRAFLGGAGEWVPGSGYLVAFALVVLCAGLWLFRRLKATFVDEI